MNSCFLKWILNIYPPYLGTGIRVKKISPDFRKIDVEMKLKWFNKNYVGTHFGGSLYAMTDPFYMLMLMHILGRDYRVLDQSASIEFIKPGRGRVTAQFLITEEMVKTVLEKTAGGKKYLHRFFVDVTDKNGEPVAKVVKQLYIRKTEKIEKKPGVPEKNGHASEES